MLHKKLNPLDICTALCLIPLLWLALDIFLDKLGANAIQALHIRLGDWSLRFLCLTLAVTPVQTLTQWRGLSDYRRLLGLYTFFYASLHLLAYLWIDHGLQWPIIGIDIWQSSYIWFGLAAYIIIFMLAITTPKLAKKRLGKSWKKLHRTIYYASVLAIVHYFWQLKGNLADPMLYLLIIMCLLGFRLLVWVKSRYLFGLMIPVKRNK